MVPASSPRYLPLLLVALCACSSPTPSPAPTDPAPAALAVDRPPDIVLVVADTLRWDYVGWHGFDGDVTPNLDRLAAESYVFDRAFSTSPWTKPAMASAMTSLHPAVHGVLDHDGQFDDPHAEATTTSSLAPGATTLAEALKAAGYRTAGFVANPWLQAAHGFAQGFDVYSTDMAGQNTPAPKVLGPAAAWLADQPADAPVFLYVHLMDAHGP